MELTEPALQKVLAFSFWSECDHSCEQSVLIPLGWQDGHFEMGSTAKAII
jgi:hypothetical protein